jgi:hypothetical protein
MPKLFCSVLLIAAALVGGSASMASENCPNFAGNFVVRGEYFGSNAISGSWGRATFSAAGAGNDNCNYTIVSKVKNFAEPLRTGTQKLTAVKDPRTGDWAFALSDTQGIVIGKGEVWESSTGVIMSIPTTGCGGEGGTGVDCGMYLRFDRL